MTEAVNAGVLQEISDSLRSARADSQTVEPVSTDSAADTGPEQDAPPVTKQEEPTADRVSAPVAEVTAEDPLPEDPPAEGDDKSSANPTPRVTKRRTSSK